MHKKSKPSYLPHVVSFDIETSSFIHEGEKFAGVWHTQTRIEDAVFNHRSLQDWSEWLKQVAEAMGTTVDNRLVIYVHNLSYEWQFIKQAFEWYAEDFFALNERKIARAVTVEGVEFRCTYLISNRSLASLAENLGMKKMVGDLDHELVRNPITPITEVEYGYIDADTEIVTAYVRSLLTRYSHDTLPMTATGFVREAVREKTLYGEEYYRTYIKGLTLDADTYGMARAAFSGGYTHANPLIAGQVLEGVVAYDLTSSYPSSMCQFQYPSTKFHKTLAPIEEELGGRAWMGVITMEGVATNYPFPTISTSRCISGQGIESDNGRVWSADYLVTTVTDVDFEIIKRCYSYDSITINRAWVAEYDHLPASLLESVLGFYAQKTQLKGVEGEEENYNKAKASVNSIYGMVATDPVREGHALDPITRDVLAEPHDVVESIEKVNSSKTRFLFYPWGAWVTAYSRSILQNVIFDLCDAGVTVVYCDTDSIYCLNSPEIDPIVNRSSAEISDRIFANLIDAGVDVSLASPQDIHGNTHELGIWDCETPDQPLEQFKTLGAKRYAKVDGGKLKVTIAGSNKKLTGEFIAENGGLDAFRSGLVVPEDSSGRLVHTYQDNEFYGEVTDYLGNVTPVLSPSSIHLGKALYSLTVGAEYSAFLENLQSLSAQVEEALVS